MAFRRLNKDKDFAQLAWLFTEVQGEAATEDGLRLEYESKIGRMLCAEVSEGKGESINGFNWAIRDNRDGSMAHIYVVVRPEAQGRGLGNALMEDLLNEVRKEGITRLRAVFRDDIPECLAFALKRGFVRKSHSLGMTLKIDDFDQSSMIPVVRRLESDGFIFTDMAALGNGIDAQMRLYELNEGTGMDIPGSGGMPSWESFEDFRKSVCGADWYNPEGQFVAIDSGNGAWAAMSAVTRFEATDYGYNLHTGVDKAYRGRKLGQAIKSFALRYAFGRLGVSEVRTNHNEENLPMIAIDLKLGYRLSRGVYLTEKHLNLKDE